MRSILVTLNMHVDPHSLGNIEIICENISKFTINRYKNAMIGITKKVETIPSKKVSECKIDKPSFSRK